MAFQNSKWQQLLESKTNINVYLFIFIGTLIVVFISIPLLYFTAQLFGRTYDWFLFVASVVLPGTITPVALYNTVKISNRLSFYQKELRDAIEENKKKELLLYEQARFAFMGEMLSNISHQWRQPLNTINLAIFSAKTELACQKLSDEHLTETFEMIETNSHYLSNTIDDFKSFFQKKDMLELREFKSIMHEVQSVIAPILKYYSIQLVVEDHIEKSVYLASPISQVLLNLVGNSVDALKSVSQTDKKIIITCKVSHGMLELTCCDNGMGIADEIKPHIFDPYFTTKPKAQGTGIGLYMSRQIVEKMFKGRLVISSLKDEALTCFKMRLRYNDEMQGEGNDTKH